MIINFDEYEGCCVGSSFSLELPVIPITGSKIRIHRSLFPSHYFDDPLRGSSLLISLNDCGANYDQFADLEVGEIELSIEESGDVKINVELVFDSNLPV